MPGATLRAATYNIHGCLGTDGRRDPARVAAVLAELQAEIIGLQEVDARASRTGIDQFAYLAQATGLSLVEQPLVFDGTGRYGNVLLTRLPLLAARCLDLSQPRREPRGAIEARLDLGGARPLRVITAHLGLSATERTHQISRLLAALAEPHHGETIMLGDFNEWLPTSRRLRWIEHRFGAAPKARLTFPSRLPLLALDRIWASAGLPIVRLGVHRSPLARQASDHLPVVADLRVATG